MARISDRAQLAKLMQSNPDAVYAAFGIGVSSALNALKSVIDRASDKSRTDVYAEVDALVYSMISDVQIMRSEAKAKEVAR